VIGAAGAAASAAVPRSDPRSGQHNRDDDRAVAQGVAAK